MREAERQSLIAELVHSDEEVRRLAVERLPALAPEEALPLLVDRLGDVSWRVRKAAAERLAVHPSRAHCVPALIASLGDGENSGRRNAALEALVSCGRAAVPALLGRVTDADPDVRKQAVDVLGVIADPLAEPVLARALDDADPNVRAAAADALGALSAGVPTERLREVARADPEVLVRLAALRALVSLGAELPLDMLSSALENPLLSVAALAALGLSGEASAAPSIAKRLLSPRSSVREAAARAFVTLTERATDHDAGAIASQLRQQAAAHPEIVRHASERLEDASGESDLARVQFCALLAAPELAAPLVRAASRPALAEAATGALRAIGPALPGALGEAWPSLTAAERSVACSVLAESSAAPAAERMLRTALLDASSEVRAAAARGLGACASAPALGELIARLAEPGEHASRELADDEASAVVEAILAIVDREGSEAGDAAILLADARLLSGEGSARLAGARLMAQLARPADAGRVRTLLTDPDARVRRFAVEAIPRLGAGAGEELLGVGLADEAPAVRAAAAHAIVRLSPASASDDLAALADDRDVRVRRAVMAVLPHFAASSSTRGRALELLAAGLRGDDLVALAALAALDRVGGADAAALASAALASPEPEIVERAVGCVGAHGGAALAHQLLPLLSHAAWPVRARVARELAAVRSAPALPHLHARLAVEQDTFVREGLLAALAALEA
jgi:HEAT repeat protein